MFMPPKFVWPTNLLVDKPRGRFPNGDLALPAKRNPVQAQPIIDHGTLADLQGARGQDLKLQPARRKQLEPACVREEFEHHVSRAGHELRGFKQEPCATRSKA